MNIAEALVKIKTQNNIYSAKISDQEKVSILSEVLERSFSEILLNKEQELSIEQENKLDEYIKEIYIDSKPLEKITKKAYFFGLELYVDENVLSPRNDTEILVEKVIEHIKKNNLKNAKILDIGTGSACIPLGIAMNCDVDKIAAVDISEAAIAVAQKNIEKYSMQDKISVVKSDLFCSLNDIKFDIIVTNPPYISKSEYKELDFKVKGYDPIVALYGGEDGLDLFHRIFESAHRFLNKNGTIFCEVGSKQAASVKEIMNNRYKDICIYKDHGNNERVIRRDFKIKESVDG